MNCYTGSWKRGPPSFISICLMWSLTLGLGFSGKNCRVAIASVYLIKYSRFLSSIWDGGLWMKRVWGLRCDMGFRSDLG